MNVVLFSGKNKNKNTSICHLLKNIPSIHNIKFVWYFCEHFALCKLILGFFNYNHFFFPKFSILRIRFMY